MSSTLQRVVVRRHHHLPAWLRLSRYTVGSAICFGISELVFVALFAPHFLGAKSASVVASIAGIIPGYYLNRSWTWGRRGRSDFWREIVPYWVTALASTLIAAVATGAVNDAFIHQPRDTRTLLNAATYMLTYGVLFIVKYLIFHRLFATSPVQAPTDDGATLPTRPARDSSS